MARAIENLENAFEEMFDFITDLPSGLDGFESDFDAAFEELKELKATLTPPNEAERAGLYGKYTVYKNKDGSLVTDCFILRPAKDPAAVAALRAYAAATDNAELAADIINWVGAEPNEPLTSDELRQMDGKPCSLCPASPPVRDCEIKEYAETCEECGFCDRASPERQEDTDGLRQAD